MWRKLQRTSLRFRLALFSATLAALVLLGTFVALSIQARNTTRELFSRELEQNGRTIVALQRENRRQLVITAGLLAESPQLKSEMATYRSERLAGNRRPDLQATFEGVLAGLGRDLPGDLLLATDEQGHVFAGYAHGATVPVHDMDLSMLPAIHHALDASFIARGEDAYLTGLEIGDRYFGVGVASLIDHGYPIGAIVFGERVDSGFVANLHRDFSGDVVVSAGEKPISSSLAPEEARVVALSADSTDRVLTFGDSEYVAATIPLGMTQRRTALRVTLLQPLTPVVASLTRTLRRDFLIYGILATILAALGAAALSRSLLRPLVGFIRYMRRGAEAEKLEAVFDTSDASQEIRVLNESFNQLMESLSGKRSELEQRGYELSAANEVLTEEIRERERIEQQLRESEAQLRQSQKLEAIGTLAGGIAHDFNNMLTVISGFTQLAMANLGKNHPVAEDLKQVSDAATSAAGLTHQLLAFSRKQVLQPRVLDLATIVQGMEGMLRRLLGARIELVISNEGAPARIKADPGQIEQVLLNLAVNARDAMADGGVLLVTTGHRHRAAGPERVVLEVQDSGSGMTREVRDRIFEPFFTTKDVGKGTGLGLSTVYGIVVQSGGSIEVETEPGEGTTFTVVFPSIMESVPYAYTDDAPDESLPGGTETVLLVDDQVAVLDLARRTLVECGYDVLIAHSAVEALTLVPPTGKVDILVTDVVMPQISGPQLAERYRAKHPNAAIVYMTGYVDDETLEIELNSDIPLLRKPFTPAELAQLVRSVLDTRREPLVARTH